MFLDIKWHKFEKLVDCPGESAGFAARAAKVLYFSGSASTKLSWASAQACAKSWSKTQDFDAPDQTLQGC